MRSLDLGCGNQPRNPFNCAELYGIDLAPRHIDGVGYVQANLALEPIPFADNYFDYVTAFDFIEHVPRQLLSLDTKAMRLPFVELMNEVWRVLRPGGVFYAVTPAYPAPESFQDPTHVNIITNKTHQYFCGDERLATRYGFVGRFAARRVEQVVFKTTLNPRQTVRKTLYHWQKRLINPKRLAHLLWELEAEK